MTTITLHPGDNRESLRRLIDQGVRVHSVVTDPPYGLVSTTKRFGNEKAAPAKFGTDGAFARASAGFMGSKWDGTGIERDPEFWTLIYDILLPGGYVLAFSSPRTGHWQACAMELAGFVMHPFLGWLYGQGFPKDHDAAKAIDKALGRKGEIAPASDEAMEWDGWSYGGQALKPALEPIYVGQKPFSEKNGALNLLKHGVGAINIDGCRPGDRHPANLLHDGSDDVVALFPDTPGQLARSSSRERRADQNVYGAMARGGEVERDPRGDMGSAARFFNTFPFDAEPIMYQGKATKADRAGSAHPTVKPIALMRWLCRLVTPQGGVVLDPFGGSGTTGEAARQEGFKCILMEAEEKFVTDIRRRFNLSIPIEIEDCDLIGVAPLVDPDLELIG